MSACHFLLVGTIVLWSTWAIAEEPKLPSSAGEFAQLTAKLESTNYQEFNTAYRALSSIARSPSSPLAKTADSTLKEFDTKASEWLLTVGNDAQDLRTGYTVLVCFDRKMPVESMRYVFRAPYRSAYAEGKEFNDEHLSVLLQLPVVSLEMSDTSVTGKSLVDCEMPELELLRIQNSPLTSDNLRKCRYPKLIILDVSGTKVTNNLLRDEQFWSLESLQIYNTRIDERGLISLMHFRDLVSLKVDCKSLTAPILTILSKNEKFRSLRVYNCLKDEVDLVREFAANTPRCEVNLMFKELKPK